MTEEFGESEAEEMFDEGKLNVSNALPGVEVYRFSSLNEAEGKEESEMANDNTSPLKSMGDVFKELKERGFIEEWDPDKLTEKDVKGVLDYEGGSSIRERTRIYFDNVFDIGRQVLTETHPSLTEEDSVLDNQSRGGVDQFHGTISRAQNGCNREGTQGKENARRRSSIIFKCLGEFRGNFNALDGTKISRSMRRNVARELSDKLCPAEGCAAEINPEGNFCAACGINYGEVMRTRTKEGFDLADTMRNVTIVGKVAARDITSYLGKGLRNAGNKTAKILFKGITYPILGNLSRRKRGWLETKLGPEWFEENSAANTSIIFNEFLYAAPLIVGPFLAQNASGSYQEVGAKATGWGIGMAFIGTLELLERLKYNKSASLAGWIAGKIIDTPSYLLKHGKRYTKDALERNRMRR